MLTRVSQFRLIRPLPEEVLESDVEINNRFHRLKKAAHYGTRYKMNSILKLSAEGGEIQVRSFIMMDNDQEVILNGGIRVWICSIREVTYEF